MRVAIDARPAAFPEPTGVGLYVRHLLRWLPRVDPGTSYLAWYLEARAPLRARRFLDPGLPNLAERRVRLPSRPFDRVAARLGAPRLEWLVDFDVLFAPNFVPPPTRSHRVVLTVHDLAFRRFPSSAPARTLAWLAGLEPALRAAAAVIAPSEATRDDLAELYAVDPAAVAVIPHGVDPAFRPPEPGDVEAVRRRLGIAGPYLLFVGGIEPRKNLPAILRAFARLPDPPALVVAGSGVAWNPEGRQGLERALRALPEAAARSVVRAGYVPPEVVPVLMGGALALVCTTRYEGFGLPALEAMACGTPVLASSSGALAEVVGEAGLLVDPTDEAAIADGMDRLRGDERLREELRARGRERARGFTWERTARRTAEVLRRVGEER